MKTMMDKSTAREIIDSWLSEITKKHITQRKEVTVLKDYLSYKQIIALSGVRRSGKTYLLFQLIQELIKKSPNNVCYINFEDERFTDAVEQLDFIYKVFLEHKNPDGKIFFFLDEIQNIKRWEKWIARMYEKNIKFFVSGSNASLLSTEFSKSLTGRHKLITIFPLSFSQFIFAKDKNLLKESSYIPEIQAKIKHLLDKYLRFGGFPEIVFEGKGDLLDGYFNDIIAKDIIFRENIKFKQSLKEIALFLMTNIGRYHSLYSLNKIIKARSINTIKNYLFYLENAYLFFKIPYFTYSLKSQLSNPFKIYAIDTGLRNSLAHNFSTDMGWLYENTVALELMRDYGKENIFYWKSSKKEEVDFVVKKATKIFRIIQVCFQITEENKKREFNSLVSASRSLKCNNLTLTTYDQEGEEKYKGKKIKIIPLWKWLLEDKI